MIANRPGVEGLERARRAGLAAEPIDHRAFAGREPFEAALTAALEAAGSSWSASPGSCGC